ncbi:peptide/nickel transport system ATP-binding protein [Kibdelosporangium banguiense]|uniref:Peptide/nickel transport system ATP-binding protein n=1 Tax=Kibdelosporangium banguiense TaxID=1365924 RepID=A0ABS4T8N2_9PSEU|nr:peptide/nickel transport system ATP-binding protein [Kibdelosporangium banguiense]
MSDFTDFGDTALKGTTRQDPTTDMLLEVDDLSVDFGTEDGAVHAVRNVSFSLGQREVLGIVGESGSGKSVSSMAIMGLLPKTAKVTGSIKFQGEQLVGLTYKQLRKYRGNRISMIFQDPMTSLNPVYTVGYQLQEAYRAHHDVSKAAAWSKAVETLALVGIPQPDRRAKQYPHEFSGGMRQRAVIAMSIINDPELIIADEPTTALDVTVQAQILETLLSIRDEANAAIMMITHDLGVVAGMVDRVQVMYGGTIVETGGVDEVFETPRMPYTVGLLGSIPNPTLLGRRLTPIKGAPPSLMNLPTGCSFSPRCPLVTDECYTAEPPLAPTGHSGHSARCIRWEHLAGVEDPRKLFATEEIGVVENPAALVEELPDLVQVEDVAEVEKRLDEQRSEEGS